MKRVMMKQNITYLLGAGASAEALPVYSNFKARFSFFHNLIKDESLRRYDGQWFQPALDQLQTDCEMLRAELEYHSTPDIVARKYFIQNELHKLNRLKAVLITYFFYEQTCRSLPRTREDEPKWVNKPILDLRYDQLVARLLKPLKGKWQFEEGVNILTWNYDYQFEMCCKNFTGKLIDAQHELFISHPSPFGIWDNEFDAPAFKILHLNGVAMASNKEPQVARVADRLTAAIDYSDYPKALLIELYHYLVHASDRLYTKLDSHLFFGWEMLDGSGMVGDNWPIRESVRRICNQTDVLIIIGYSFPSFNEVIDSFIFQNCIRLHTICVQDSQFPNIKGIIESSLLPQIPKQNPYKTNIIDIGYVNQFFIPRNEIIGIRKSEDVSFI